MFIKGFAIGLNLRQTIIALAIARRFHDGQYRKGGDPYLIHPLKVCSTLISAGINDDITLAASLLHDVVEDCDLPLGGTELVTNYGVDPQVLDIVKRVSKQPGLNQSQLSEYFNNIKFDIRAILIKVADRAHNSESLYEFSVEKIHKNVKETRDFILPLCSYAKCYYPEYSNAITIMKSQIVSLCNTVEVMLEKFNK